VVEELNITFKKLILLSVLTVLMGVGIVYALGYEFKPQNSIQTFPTAEGVNDQFGLELTMTLQKTEYSLGEPINITLTITNIGNQTINYIYCESGHRFDFRVYNDTNNSIYHWSGFAWFPQANDYITLNPGESLTVGQAAGYPVQPTGHYVWQQTQTYFNGTEVPVSPGTYYIVGQTGLICSINGKEISEYRLDKQFVPLVVETAPIQVTIVKQ
jgi:hypothetical protein